MRWNESDCGSVKIFGSSAAKAFASPAPSSSTERFLRARRVAPRRPGGRHQRRLDLPRRPARVLLQQQRGRARDVRRRHRRAGEDRERRAGRRGRRRREDVEPPGAETSGFSRWPKSVGPADEKLVITPLRSVGISWMSGRDADRRLAAVRRGVRAQLLRRRGRRSSRPGAAARPGSRSPRRSGCRSGSIPIAPASARALRLRRRRCRCRARRARSCPSSEPFGSVPRPVFGSVGGAAEVRVDRLAVGADDRSRRRRPSGRASTSAPAASRRRALDRDRRRATAGRRRRSSAGANTCEFETAATEIASGAVPGEPARAEAEVVAVVAGGDHGDDAGERGVVHRLVHRVVRRIGLRAAAREVDHVHPVGDCGLERLRRSPACSPRGRAASGP